MTNSMDNIADFLPAQEKGKCYTSSMWPFKKKPKEEKGNHIAKRVIAGLIIGGAIGSIVGKKLLDEHRQKNEEEKEDLS